MYSKKVQIMIICIAVLFLCAAGILIWLGWSTDKEQGLPTKSLLQAVVQDNTLSEQGAITKKNLIASLDGKAGTILATQDMGIGYIPPPDESVMVFITGTDIERIESDAVSWLMSRGFSRDDLCYLPVVFSVVNWRAQTESAYKLYTNHLPDYCPEVLGVE